MAGNTIPHVVCLLQAAMTDPILGFRGNTEEVMFRFNPGTLEAHMWLHMLVDCGLQGSLQRSDRVEVT